MDSLILAIDVLAGSPRYRCHCGYATNHRWVLKRHQLIHTNTRPYVCKICKAGFRQSQHLTGHLRAHKNPKYHARFMNI